MVEHVDDDAVGDIEGSVLKNIDYGGDDFLEYMDELEDDLPVDDMEDSDWEPDSDYEDDDAEKENYQVYKQA